MKKRMLLMLFLACLCLLLCGCMAKVVDPLVKAESTPAPGLTNRLHAAAASESNVDEVTVSLYYRYMDEPLLAREERTISVRRDESTELALVRALLEGPGAGHSELERLFPEGVRVEGVSARDGIVFVTLSEELLTQEQPPTGWQEDAALAQEWPLRRRLTIASLVASITDSFAYTGVQIMVDRPGEATASLRLENSYFLGGGTGLSDPRAREEALLLTPRTVTLRVMEMWQARDFETLYRYVAFQGENGAQPRPAYAKAAEELDGCPPLVSYSVSAGTVIRQGTAAVIAASTQVNVDGELRDVKNYPLGLKQENGVWKLDFDRLLKWMNQ